MQFPESWLRELCNPPMSTQALADVLTMAGLEVEELRPVAPSFSGVVVAEVLEVAKHPDADRLNVCKVNAGTGAPLQIVCGASNVRPGIKVPCALVGAELPPGENGQPFKIKLGKLRGVESSGMLCSAKEIGLAAEASGLHLFADDAPVGVGVREYLQLDDTLFTLKLTPNLAHCLSVLGVAREVSALTGAPLNVPAAQTVAPTLDERLSVQVQAPDLCGRFTGRVIRNVNPLAKTPAWMVQRLERCGQRSVSALVDISNYVMFELGQPSHIFDLDKICGSLQVRWGRVGETVELLNGQTVTVDEHVGVIADDERVESLAGVMGGQVVAVSDDTRNVYAEVAFWWPKSIAGRARRFNFSTDASHRFERGVDPAQTVERLDRITQLIIEICGGEPGPVDDQRVNMPQPQPVAMRLDRAARVIGMPVSQAQCEAVFKRLGLPCTVDGDRLVVTPPSWRFDVQIEEDLIEEVVRVIGFDKLPRRAPLAPVSPRVRPEAVRGAYAVRRAVAARGYQETINFSFVEERWERELAGNDQPIRLLNPIASPLSVMRSSLLGGLVQVLRHNLARKASRVRVFEVGRVFLRDATVADTDATVGGLSQPLRVAGLAYGAIDELQWGCAERAVDFFDVKGDIEALLAPRQARFVRAEHPALHPGRCACIEIDGQVVGFVGELHPRWRQGYELPAAPVLFELDAAALIARPVPAFAGMPRQQSVWRDIAVIADDHVSHERLLQAIDAAPTQGLVRQATLFDIYKPKAPTPDISAHQRSLAVRLELLDDEATLTDERIEAAVQAVLGTLQAQLGVRQRA